MFISFPIISDFMIIDFFLQIANPFNLDSIIIESSSIREYPVKIESYIKQLSLHESSNRSVGILIFREHNNDYLFQSQNNDHFRFSFV